MKILVVCQHYWPEPYPLEDTCEELVKRGHTVHVVTGVPNYPMGYIYNEYRRGRNRSQVRNGVKITRTFTIGRRQNLVFRLLNYFSYPISSTLHVLGLKEDFDVVYTNQTSPVMMVNAALAYGKKHGKKTVLYCMDLWPASLAAGGVKESSPIYKVFGWISRKLYRKADKILVTSRMFTEYFEDQFGISGDRVEYLPQYADSLFGVQPAREEDGFVNLVFAGNVGAAQSLGTVLEAAKLLEHRRNLRWHIVGDGSELENLKKLASDMRLENVIFHGRKPLEEMPKYYAMADAMIVTLTADPFISMTLPGKVQTYMAAGKPIVAAAIGEIPNVIRDSGCGFCAKAEDARGFAGAVEQFLDCENKEQLGRNARQFYLEHFTRDMFMDHLESVLKEHCT
ncbi:MAG: glycosyltransferase family 4 protein [Oscillospiraceae bacterium]|nr:glycosyltransferase family 4 protein [Oscillospiraceae bacterium]